MDTLTLSVSLPGELRSLLGAPTQAAEVVKEFAILGLYQDGRLSAGKPQNC